MGKCKYRKLSGKIFGKIVSLTIFIPHFGLIIEDFINYHIVVKLNETLFN